MKLKKFEVCPKYLNCPHNDNCKGADASRGNEFDCSFVGESGFISQGFRNPLDETGKMQILIEDEKI